MIKKIIMPSGGQTTDEMTIQKIYVKTGEKVSVGDILFDIETDKAVLSVESFADGIILALKYGEGDKVRTGEVVAWIGDKDDKVPEEDAAVPVPVKKAAEKQSPVSVEHSADRKPEAGKVYASPLAKNMARIEKIKLEDIAAFCSKTLLKKEDVDNFLQQRKGTSSDGDFYSIAPSTMRKTIARRMKQSFTSIPHYYVSIDVDMTEMVKLRKRLNEIIPEHGTRIAFNDILMKVIARAAGAFPLVNSNYTDEEIRIFRNVSIGLAVSLESGLIVPVVKDVNSKSIAEISEANASNISAAKAGRLKEQDITGGTITLSNLGMFGISEFTAIINQPETCILAVGAIIEKPVVKDHQVVIREMMNITGSFDHRIIDGAVGAAFLARIKEIIEEPGLLFMTREKYLTER